MSSAAEKVKSKLRAKKQEAPFDPAACLSSGLTLINLACSGNHKWAFAPGHYYMFVGQSSSGKTFLLRQLMAEATINARYKSYRLIHDDPERGALMNIAKFFGGGLASRIELPGGDISSQTLEEFYDYVDDAVKDGRPFIYGLDSEDALPSESEIQKSREDKSARRKGREASGSYNMSKPKKNSSGLRVANNGLKETGSLLFVIKQTRQNVGYGAQFNPETRNGGEALTFFATNELWFSVKGKIRKKVHGKARVIGSRLRVHVKKNRESGRERSVDLIFYPTVGFDDVGSNVEFLVEERFWEGKRDKESNTITEVEAKDFKITGTVDQVVKEIESKGGEQELRLIVQEVWDDVEAACSVERKNRYQL